ncbi:MAG: hypothetical protein HY885_05895 [Deltaproteobacteria bacterium]|nr:hypothetical protein [Deltaproteobacteria bacterium]
MQIILLALAALIQPETLPALDLPDRVQLHGFASQGYLNSSGNNFLSDSIGGTFAFNEIGVNLNGLINNNFRYGGQLLSKKMGDYGDNDIRLDWGLVDYRVHDWGGARLGKVKIPVGLYNTERDSDFLRPMIFLPQSIYDETRRDTWQAHWGGEAYGNVEIPAFGNFDYKLFYGRIKYDEDSVFHDSTLTNINKRLADNQQAANPDPTLPPRIDDCDRDNEYLYGASLIYSPQVENLRLGVSWASQKDTSYGDSARIGGYKTNSNFVLSLEYSWRDFSLSAEYGENDRTQTLYDITTFDGPNQSWYVMLSYAATSRLSFTALYDEYWKDKHNKDDSVHASGRYNPSPWRKDWACGVRYDVNERWTVKGEWHTVDGTALLLDFFNPDGTERYWQYGAVKVSFNF